MKIRVRPEAEAEVEDARCWLNERSPELGDRFVKDFEATLAEILQNPLRFRKVETLPGDHPFRRARLSVFRYLVIFEQLPDEVVVVAVPHASQKPNYWFGRR